MEKNSTTLNFIQALEDHKERNMTPTKTMDKSQDVVSRLNDMFAWRSSPQFAKNESASYYYLDEPTQLELYKTARFSPLGWRLTYGYANDVMSNLLKIKIKGLDPKDQEKKDQLIHKHFIDIKFYEEFTKCVGYNFEQGEALLVSHRQDGIFTPESVEEDDKDFGPHYTSLENPANPTSPIVRVEAINNIDYNIPKIKEFGLPEYYRISFFQKGMAKPVYKVHTSHCLRVRTNDIEYDTYRGQSKLKCVFGELTILHAITRACGDASFRWGLGIPAIYTKGLTDSTKRAEAKSAIGNPTTQSWLFIPSEVVEKIEMLGLAGTMMDLNKLADLVINMIVSATQIPRPILMGEVAGVVTGSEVNERAYFATLDKEHTALDRFLREFIRNDPYLMEIIGESDYEIDWGLRQVMSEIDKATLQQLKLSNASSAMAFCTFNEVRKIAGLEPWEDVMKEEKLCEELYGFTAKEMGSMIASTIASIFMKNTIMEGQNGPEQSNSNPNNPQNKNDNEEDDMKRDSNNPLKYNKEEKQKVEKKIKDSAMDLSKLIVTYRDITNIPETKNLLKISKGKISNFVDKLNEIAE